MAIDLATLVPIPLLVVLLLSGDIRHIPEKCTFLKSSFVAALQGLQPQKQSPRLVRLALTLQRCPPAEMSSWAALHPLMLICWTTLTQRLLQQLQKGQRTNRALRPVTHLVKRHTRTCCNGT